MDLHPGLYEQVINNELNNKLSKINDNCKAIEPIDKYEYPDVLSRYVASIIQKGLKNLSDSREDISVQIKLVNDIVKLIQKATNEDDFGNMIIDLEAKQLLALLSQSDPRLVIGKTASDIERPETSIAKSSLFTGARQEPQMFTELRKEIASSDRIDMLVSFIKWSGLRLIIDELGKFTSNGGRLRVITTSYMGATDIKAVEELRKLPNTELKISYNTETTRLHAKAYVFFRETGFTTAYVGSSNLSNAALSSGLEWNTKVTKRDLPETIDKIEATFEYYWNDREFEFYSEKQKERFAKALKAEKYFDANNDAIYTMDIRPYSYQSQILDKLDAERKIHGRMRNLIVAATGTGKTVISALDYRNFRKENPSKSSHLLFVAHREEILKQSMYTFRAILRNANFGDMFVGNHKPNSIENLFISIQTLNSQNFTEKTSDDFYDYIIVDEFHHAAAPTYKKLLSYYKPKILLGLTATPERMDGKNILEYFDNHIAAEIRLPEAIDRKLLCPFQYFGITDTVDLDTLKWSAGGYDKKELSNIYTLSGFTATRRADYVVSSLLRYVTDIAFVKGLGFCVSIEHACFMSRHFNEHGIPSISLTGKSTDDERNTARDKLVNGDIKFIFVVDIYNEGVDIPEVNTVLFLRPTESLTIFLQQLGRGLRLSENKECLTVLDFIGQANKKYNFESKFASLLSNTNHSVSNEIKNGFVSMPKGCYIQLEEKAAKYILDNIKAAYGNTSGLVSHIASFEEDSGKKLSLSNFLDYYHLDPRMIYKFASFSRLCANSKVTKDFSESLEDTLTKAFSKFAIMDSRRWISFLLDTLPRIGNLDFNTISDLEKRMLQMFYVTVWSKTADNWSDREIQSNLKSLSSSKVLLHELIELLQYRLEKIDFVDLNVDLGFDCPLDLHCTYTRDQILVAMDFMKPSTVREGVKWLPDKHLDVFFITLNKSDKDYSPTTMYNDYSINETLFHWQSQSTTDEKSKTGQRYIHHKELGSKILLFVREFKSDRLSKNAEAYTFLGLANYVKHEGSKPMNITWRLKNPIPAKFLAKTNKLVVG